MTNTSRHDVISLFLDGEPFESRALGDALADASGRELLLDLIALRSLMHIPSAADGPPTRSRRRGWRSLAAAAAVCAALAGGYVWGSREHRSSRPPEATVVIRPDVWVDVKQ